MLSTKCGEFFAPLSCYAACVSGQPIASIFMVKQYKNVHLNKVAKNFSETSVSNYQLTYAA